ncbi:hypothetical protein BKI52_07430 [marine bacterium AO1-C]|nr:hypothetical protein BKI52_07430 [marine bacterium AO1-C]
MHQRLLLGCIISLLGGGLIYLGFRSDTLILFDWISFIGLDHLIERLRFYTLPYAKYIPEWILFSLPDGLWMFSYGCGICYLWRNKQSKQPHWWISLIALFILSVEILQLLQITPGTFDPLDLVFYLLGALLPLVFLIQKDNRWVASK